MRVLITWGSKLEGTAGVAEILGSALRDAGIEVVLAPSDLAPSPRGYDGVIVGGSLSANRWHVDARRFVERHARTLRDIPTWLFASGPLDATADRGDLEPPRQLRALQERIGALGLATFGGRHASTVTGVGGDRRDPARIRAWAGEIASALPAAVPGVAIAHPGRSIVRLFEYGVVGWAASAAVLVGLLAISTLGVTLTLHAVLAPLVFGALAVRYQRVVGARAPLVMAAGWTAIVALLHVLVLEVLIARAVSLPGLWAFWLPLALIFLASLGAGALSARLPLPGATPARAAPLTPTPG